MVWIQSPAQDSLPRIKNWESLHTSYTFLLKKNLPANPTFLSIFRDKTQVRQPSGLPQYSDAKGQKGETSSRNLFWSRVNSANVKTAKVAFCAQWSCRDAKGCHIRSLCSTHIGTDSQKTLQHRLSPTEDVDYYCHFFSKSTDIQIG